MVFDRSEIFNIKFSEIDYSGPRNPTVTSRWHLYSRKRSMTQWKCKKQKNPKQTPKRKQNNTCYVENVIIIIFFFLCPAGTTTWGASDVYSREFAIIQYYFILLSIVGGPAAWSLTTRARRTHTSNTLWQRFWPQKQFSGLSSSMRSATLSGYYIVTLRSERREKIWIKYILSICYRIMSDWNICIIY